jgi:hypothetical protein
MTSTERRRRYKRFLLFCLACLAWLLVGVAGAYFTGQAQVAENVIRAGSVSISTEPTASALSIDSLAPGESVTRPLTVINDGSLRANFVVTGVKKAGITEFYEALTCKVTVQALTLYEGPLTGLRTLALPIKPGERVPLQITVGLPATAGNDLAGDYVKLSLYVDAEQAHDPAPVN